MLHSQLLIRSIGVAKAQFPVDAVWDLRGYGEHWREQALVRKNRPNLHNIRWTGILNHYNACLYAEQNHLRQV